MRAECFCVPVLRAACFMPSALLTRAKCASGIYQICVPSCVGFALRDSYVALFSSGANVAAAHLMLSGLLGSLERLYLTTDILCHLGTLLLLV